MRAFGWFLTPPGHSFHKHQSGWSKAESSTSPGLQDVILVLQHLPETDVLLTSSQSQTNISPSSLVRPQRPLPHAGSLASSWKLLPPCPLKRGLILKILPGTFTSPTSLRSSWLSCWAPPCSWSQVLLLHQTHPPTCCLGQEVWSLQLLGPGPQNPPPGLQPPPSLLLCSAFTVKV